MRQAVGVAAVTAGPGVTNTITAIKNAQMAEVPIILLGGGAPTLLKNRGALQDIDQLILFRPLCKYVTSVTRVRDIIPSLRKAFQIARSGTPGPVFLEFPIDVLYPYDVVLKLLDLKVPKTFKQRLLNGYLLAHTSRLFGGVVVDGEPLVPLPPNIPLPYSADIDKAVNMIEHSVKPVLLVGSQATLPPVPITQLKNAIEKLNIPVYLGGMARGLLGMESKCLFRHGRRDALRDADLIILAGTVCDFRLNYGRLFSKKAKVISINRDFKQATKNEDVFWCASLLIVADVASSLCQISEKLQEVHEYRKTSEEWINELSERESAKEKEILQKKESQLTDGKLNPLRVLSELNEVLPEDAILVADGGDFVGSAAYIVKPRGPLRWLDPGAFGTLGVGGGFALGAKAVFPNSPVFILYGDGSCGFSLMEFDTFVRHKMPIVAVIGNDACWSQIEREQVVLFNSSVATNLEHARYEKIAEAFGAKGELLTIEMTKQLRQRLIEIIETNNSGFSIILNVIIGKTKFREGSISV
ncbi:hypothetical protein AB6A40_007544 [Gnathostoma spinigerum]|uniref:2-hydroxyacyl-CoA lyase 2 n=1 Tax=Gnathostoma spinigerum TaxID=75299 RepID=A0ABD6EX50_9BILA